MFTAAFLAAGFAILVKGADLLVEGAVSLARRLGVSDLVVGLTVVSFGTSCPELFVSLLASARGNPDIAMGNVLGSNIANVLLVLGASAAVRPLAVSRSAVAWEIPASLFASLLLWDMASDTTSPDAPGLSRGDGLVLLGFLAIFLLRSYSASRGGEPPADMPAAPAHGLARSFLMVATGLVFLALGGHFIVDSAVKIAYWAGMPESVVGLTVVAVGTSLPEMATSVTAALRGMSDIAVGNVVGSNLFNILLILGVSAVVRPLPFNPANHPDLAVMAGSNALLLAFLALGGKRGLGGREGAVFLILYGGYIAYLLAFHR